MHPAATLFVDVCVQPDLWCGGTWPLVTSAQARGVADLFVLAGDLDLRQGGIVCRHAPESEFSMQGSSLHCLQPGAGHERPPACVPRLPIQVWEGVELTDEGPPLDREHALYLDSGCGLAPDGDVGHARAFNHLTAGVRDAVVFGAGIEGGLDQAVRALLRRRIRVHVALDAAGTADERAAQLIVADWKRRGVDGTTVGMIERMLRRA